MAPAMWEVLGTMQQQLWAGAGAAVLVALASGFGDHRRRRRRDMDRVGVMPWTLIQVLAMLAAVILASMALNLR
jgi:predicted membrane protein